MFFGEYRHQLDEKCRVRIPAKLKEQLGSHPFIMKGPNECLLVLKQDDANEFLTRQFGNVDMVDPKNNASLRMITSSAFFADEDKQGRILLPSVLREFAGIQKEVVLAGVVSRIEIWSKDRWQAENGYDGMEEVAEHMASLGLMI